MGTRNKSTSESGTDTDSDSSERRRDTVSFTLQDVYSETSLKVAPPDKAGNIAESLLSQNSCSTRRVPYKNKVGYEESPRKHDAMSAGWIISNPSTFRVASLGVNEDRETSKGPVVTTPCDIEVSEFIETEETEEGVVVWVNTFWEVEFPDGYAGYMTRPFMTNTAIQPQRIPSSEEINGPFPIKVPIYVPNGSEYELLSGTPIAQIIPTDAQIPTISSRGVSSEEFTDIQIEERRRRIYPDVYEQERFTASPGSLKPQPQCERSSEETPSNNTDETDC